MKEVLALPEGALGRFAIVKLWPDLKTAEDECIARIRATAEQFGLECLEVDALGRLLSNPSVWVDSKSVDFVLHLHYDTPKCYDAFSFVALWNPIAFYHQWGYARCSRNLTTHDDFLSCSSDAADDHVSRMIRRASTHLSPEFRFYHSTPGISFQPSLGEEKLFYAGINWEALNGGKSRHQDVLKSLDRLDILRIYGPYKFQGIRVWQGYKSYVREVPFDGISMIQEISKAGIALVMSSQAHKDSALMSSRLFESISAGALIICDENPFARRFFGDSLLYIDGRSPVEQICSEIVRHVEWAKNNKAAALAMIARAQKRFVEGFSLTKSLSYLYAELPARKRQLSALRNPQDAPGLSVSVNLLMPSFSTTVLKQHVRSVAVQAYSDFTATLVVDSEDLKEHRQDIEAILVTSPVPIALREVKFWERCRQGDMPRARRLGEVVQDIVDLARRYDALVVVAPNEKLFSDHVSVLAGALRRDPGTKCAATAAILENGDLPINSVHEFLDFGGLNDSGPPGFGRFIFRTSAIPEDVRIALRHMQSRPLAILVGRNPIVQQLPATVIIDLEHPFGLSTQHEAEESAIIRDFSPEALKISAGLIPQPAVMAASVEAWISPRGILGRLTSPHWIKRQLYELARVGAAERLRAIRKRLRERR